MRLMRTLALCLLAVLTPALHSGCGSTGLLSETVHNPKRPVRNVIFVVGDGMGLSQITAGNYANNNQSVFERFPIVGIQKTHSADDLITDSAAGATAFSTGEKTYNGAIAVDINKSPLQTLFEEGEALGYETGLAVTSTITHATPACFYAHDESRNNYQAIAEDLALSQVDVAIGYGLDQFNAREDGRDLVLVMAERGIKVHTKLDDLMVQKKTRQMVLLPGVDPPKAEGRPYDYLRTASMKAIEQLEANKAPFLLVVEGSQIDWGGHANDSDWIVDEMLDFDRTLNAILDWAAEDGETLVVVTADHETGGYAINKGILDEFAFETAFTTKKHTATMVPVFAYGPSAELFSGMYDNTAIHAKMRQALGWE
jgi:alkaline phosphatase